MCQAYSLHLTISVMGTPGATALIHLSSQSALQRPMTRHHTCYIVQGEGEMGIMVNLSLLFLLHYGVGGKAGGKSFGYGEMPGFCFFHIEA